MIGILVKALIKTIGIFILSLVCSYLVILTVSFIEGDMNILSKACKTIIFDDKLHRVLIVTFILGIIFHFFAQKFKNPCITKK